MALNLSKFDQASVIKYRVKKLSESSSSIVFSCIMSLVGTD